MSMNAETRANIMLQLLWTEEKEKRKRKKFMVVKRVLKKGEKKG